MLQRPVESTQYASQDFRNTLKEYGIMASMSRRGDCWDNACSETLFGSLKVERLYGQKFETRRQAKDEVIDWLLWYNQTRLHVGDDVNPLLFAGDAAFLFGVGRRWRLKDLKWAEPRAGLC